MFVAGLRDNIILISNPAFSFLVKRVSERFKVRIFSKTLNYAEKFKCSFQKPP